MKVYAQSANNVVKKIWANPRGQRVIYLSSFLKGFIHYLSLRNTDLKYKYYSFFFTASHNQHVDQFFLKPQ